MNKNEIKKLLDKTDIYVLDEINIIEYIDELEQIKEDYIKSLDKLDVLENRLDKAIEYIEQFDFDYLDATYNHSTREILEDLLDILRGEK